MEGTGWAVGQLKALSNPFLSANNSRLREHLTEDFQRSESFFRILESFSASPRRKVVSTKMLLNGEKRPMDRPVPPCVENSQAATTCKQPGMATSLGGIGHSPIHTKKTLEDWVIEIKGFFTRASTDTIDLARTVHAARRELSFGQWSGLYRLGRLPFSKRTGERMVAIWEGLRALDATTLSHFPNARSSLYVLSRLPSDLLSRLVREGAIHPSLSLGAAKELAAKHQASRSSPRGHVRTRVRKFCDFVRANHKRWNSQDRGFAVEVLGELVDELGQPLRSGHCTREDLVVLSMNSTAVFSSKP